MAKYNLDNVKENKEFLEFIKEMGYNSFDDVPWYEKNALLNSFRMRTDDLEDADYAKFAETRNNPNLQDISNIYFDGRKLEDLSMEEQAFMHTLAAELEAENAPSLNDIVVRRSSPAAGVTTKTTVEYDNVQAESANVQQSGTANVQQSGTANVQQSGTAAAQNATGQAAAFEAEEERLRSAHSDRNEFFLEALQLQVLHDMKIVDDKTFAEAVKSPRTVMETFHQNENLSAGQRAEFESRLTDKMAESPSLLSVIPPRFLADRYEGLHEEIARQKEQNKDYDDTTARQKLSVLEGRIDELSANLAEGRGLYLTDVTNVADTYDGYMKMFDVREKHLSDKGEDVAKKEQITRGRAILNETVGEYDREWNLEGLTPQDADRLEKRSAELAKNLEAVELSEESMALVSNFKFLDKDGNVEPQFVGPNGEKSDVWQKGYKLDKEGKLADVVRITRQNVLMDNLGGKDEIKAEDLARELNERVPTTLFSLHVSDKTVQGAMEHPDEFTNKKYIDAFVSDLSNIEKPMTVSAVGYDAGVDRLIDEVGGYASRLGSKVGKDKAVVTGMFEPLKDLDKRADHRTEGSNVSKKQVRKELLKRTAKGALSAFFVSGAITLAGAAAASDATLTAATGGMNKLAGAAIGTGLATVAAIRNIRRWRKAQKAAGKPANLKAALKDKRLMVTLTTTAMGAAALGFAATGNPGVAQALGYGSMALGMGTGIVTNYKDARKGGLSGAEAFGWAALQAGTTAAAAYGGRLTGNAAIDWYNDTYKDNNLFQHEEKIGSHKEIDHYETVTDYSALNENAEKFLENNWYKDHPELLQQRIDALTAAGVENPHHMLLAAHDAGMRAPDNMKMWDGTTSQGNHTVLTKAWALENNVPYEDVQAVRNLFDANGNVNPQAVDAYQSVAPHIAEDNFVTRITDRPVIRELYGDRESTYDAQRNVPTREVPVYKDVDDYGMVRNQSDLGYGMVGVMPAAQQGKKSLKERIGSLADRLFSKRGKTLPPPEPKREQSKTKTVVVEDEAAIEKMLIDEYKIVYGTEPEMQEGKNKQWKDYCKRVEVERRNADAGKNMTDFLLERRKNFDQMFFGDRAMVSNVDVTASGVPVRNDYMMHAVKNNRGKAAAVCEARQSLMQSNLSRDNYLNKITLSHFTKYTRHHLAKDEVVSDGSRNFELNPRLKGKYDKEGSKVAMVDLNEYLAEGKTLEESTQRVSGKDIRQAAAEMKKRRDREGSR